ncbi:MAG: histidine phosphatase family protein [Desulfomonile tiedjei]|uniref:Histidine phosphatase family protein n=1 Tax=Desulfomonile tiedjei TaxID=2358 RepID=A0A9D6Z886_9BACT|nr:histidine phosphatase family protein [Desulfomonile tiedjei]
MKLLSHPRSAIVLIVFFLLSGGAWAQTSGDQPEAPTTVIILRHADKAGDVGNVSLSLAGEIRARILAQMCGSSGLAALYGVTDTENDRRVRQTLQPIAELLSIEPNILTDPLAIKRCAHEIRTRYNGRVILVASHSGTVQGIIKALGGDDTCCPIGRDYDDLCVVTMHPVGKVNVLRLKYGTTK